METNIHITRINLAKSMLEDWLQYSALYTTKKHYERLDDLTSKAFMCADELRASGHPQADEINKELVALIDKAYAVMDAR